MKKIINRNIKPIGIILILMLNIAGCQKVFEEDIQNTLELNTRTDYNHAMAGLYNRLFYSIMGNFVIYIVPIANEDDLSTEPKNGTPEDLGVIYESSNNGSISNSSLELSSIYKLHYQTIGMANNILSKAGNISKIDPEIKKIIGEVYFIRAYSYFRLVRLCGQVRIVDNPDVDFSYQRASLKELYQFIEKDLQKSIELLPNNNNESRIKYETPHRGTAKALLAEVYLTMGGSLLNDQSKYASAAKIAKEVIDSGAYFGFGLLPDLANLWNGTQPRNPESEFSILILDSTKDLSHGFDIYNNESYFFLNKHGGFNIKAGSPYSDIRVTPNFYNSFPRNYRKEVSFQTRHVPNNFSHIWDPVKRDYILIFDSLYIKHYDSINASTDLAYKKFFTQFDLPDSALLNRRYYHARFYGHYRGGVVYIFRYAHTLLTYAEAKARIGELDGSAYEAINQVRRRANKLDLNTPSSFDLQSGLSQQQFVDSVIQERAWELCAEPEGRWFDIMRLNLTSKLYEIKKNQNVMVYPIPTQKNNFYLPIPDEDNQ
jgi:hypothetical protein